MCPPGGGTDPLGEDRTRPNALHQLRRRREYKSALAMTEAEDGTPSCLPPIPFRPPPDHLSTPQLIRVVASPAVDIFGDGAEDDLGEEIARADTDEIAQRTRMLENEIKVIRNEVMRLNHEHQAQKEKIKENQEKVKLNKQLPFLVANVVELLDMELEDEPEEDGANIDLDAHRKGKCCVLKTSTRQTIFLPCRASSSLRSSSRPTWWA